MKNNKSINYNQFKNTLCMSCILLLFFIITACNNNSKKTPNGSTHNENIYSSEKNSMKIRVVILNPKGREIPIHTNKFINEIAAYTSNFYIEGMKKHGYPVKNKNIFELNPNGEVKIYISNSPNNMYEIEDIKNKKEHAYNHIVGNKPVFENSVWWIFSNITDEVKYGFTGGGNVILGNSIANLPQQYEKIAPEINLGSSGYFTKNSIKAIVHELGHALQLPHNGPIHLSLGKDPNGNTLMGPIIKSFKKRYDANEDRVYLSKISAAMLWKHPVFNNTQYKAYGDTKFEIVDIKMNYSEEENVTNIKGNIKTSLPYHSVILIDVPIRNFKRRNNNTNEFKNISPNSNRKKRSTAQRVKPSYHDRGYLATLNNKGEFEFSVDKMITKQGSFLIAACFDNGLITSKINSNDEVKKNWKIVKYNF